MKINELHNQPIQADTYEASMALNQLLKIGKHSIKLHNLIKDDAEMEAWVAKKIDLAGDYVKSVHGYMQGENKNLYDDGGLTEDAPFGSGFDLLRMAIMKKFISVQEWDLLKHKWNDAADEVEQKYADWPDGEGFGSSDHNFAIKDLMTAVGYEFDDKDTSGRFVVTKQPEEIEKAGIKNARMKDAMPTEDGSSHTSMNKYGLSARNHKGKFYSYKHGKLTGAFDSMKDLAKHQEELIKDESVSEDAGEKIANMAQNMTKDEFMSHADELGLTPEEAAEHYEKMQGGAHAGKFEDADESKYYQYTGKGFAIKPSGQSHWADKGELPDSINVKGLMIAHYPDMDDYVELVMDHDGPWEIYTDKAITGSLEKNLGMPTGSIQWSEQGQQEKGRAHFDVDSTAGQKIAVSPMFKQVRAEESVEEDAGEGHMSKSTLYHTAKYAIELASMIKPGDDLEGWVQSKLNKAADYLIGAYNYEEYQKLNPYREDLDTDTFAKHSQIVQKNIDEILSKETDIDDIDTKPGMMRILSKRVNEVEKAMSREIKEKTTEEDLDEGLKDWAKKLAAAGVIVGAVAGMGSINNAIDNSVPAVKAMNNAYEMAVDAGNTELANNIKKDISDAKLRLDTGKDLNHIKYLQDKYSKFMPTEGLAYESKLAIMLNKSLK